MGGGVGIEVTLPNPWWERTFPKPGVAACGTKPAVVLFLRLVREEQEGQKPAVPRFTKTEGYKHGKNGKNGNVVFGKYSAVDLIYMRSGRVARTVPTGISHSIPHPTRVCVFREPRGAYQQVIVIQ